MLATLTNIGYTQTTISPINCESTRVTCVFVGNSPLVPTRTVPPIIGEVTAPGPYNFTLDDVPNVGDFNPGTGWQLLAPKYGADAQAVRVHLVNHEVQFFPRAVAATATDEFWIGGTADGIDTIVPFRITIRCRPEDCPPNQPARRESDDDKFDDFAIYSGIAILGTWAFNKYGLPGFSNIGNRIKFQAKPTSNKSLQYNLSTDINKNWSANFTVDKQVKINSETNNSNLYKLKFEYRF